MKLLYDVAIVGGGPAGYTAALEAAKHKLKAIIFEREKVGGTCLNEGCIPLKSFLHVSKIARQSELAGFQKQGTDMAAISDISKRNVEKLKQGLMYSLKKEYITIVSEEVTDIERDESYSLKTDNGLYFAANVVIATGSEQVVPQITGLGLALESGKVVTSREFFQLKVMYNEIAILGAGAIGLEIASFFTDFGKSVTVIDSEERILKEMDEDVYTFYLTQLKNRGIRFLLGVRVCEVDSSSDGVCIVYQQGDEIDEMHVDLMVLATGRKPITKFNHIEGVYVCGDANGKSMLAHMAMREAKAAINQITGKKDIVDYDKIPHVIYTTPEAAWIGRGEDMFADKINLAIVKKSLDYSSRYVIESDGVQGMVKEIFEKNFFSGCQIIGDGAAEIVSFLKIAASESEVVFPHPSIAEIINYL